MGGTHEPLAGYVMASGHRRDVASFGGGSSPCTRQNEDQTADLKVTHFVDAPSEWCDPHFTTNSHTSRDAMITSRRVSSDVTAPLRR